MPHNVLSVWSHLVLQLPHKLSSFPSADITCWSTSKVVTTIWSNASDLSNWEEVLEQSIDFLSKPSNTSILDLFLRWLRACSFLCSSVASVVSDCVGLHGLQPTRLLCPWNSPGKNTGLGCHTLLHGIIPTQGSNTHLLHLLSWQVDSLPLAPLGKPQTGSTRLIHLQ